jgi:hypothetical protein
MVKRLERVLAISAMYGENWWLTWALVNTSCAEGADATRLAPVEGGGDWPPDALLGEVGSDRSQVHGGGKEKRGEKAGCGSYMSTAGL